MDKRRKSRAVRCRPLQNQTARKVQAERDAFLHILIASAIAHPTDRLGRHWILVDQPAAGIHAIDAEIGEWTSTAELFREQPCRGVITERTEFRKQRVNDVDSA